MCYSAEICKLQHQAGNPNPVNGITGRKDQGLRQTGLQSTDKGGAPHLKIPHPPSLPLTHSLWAQRVCKVLVCRPGEETGREIHSKSMKTSDRFLKWSLTQGLPP